MSKAFEVTIPNLPALRRAFREYPRIAAPVMTRALSATAAIFAKHTHKDDPVPVRTGNLLVSFRFKSSPIEARFGPTARYARYVNFDNRTGPVRVRVKTGRYATSRSGRSYYKSATGSSVTTKPRMSHFMEKILKNSTPDVGKLFKEAGDIIVRDIARQVNAG